MLNIVDADLYKAINSLAGKNVFLDELFKGLASDYFLLVSICLFLVFLWFTGKDKIIRESHQYAVIITLLAIGIANGLVAWCNHYYFRIRPFNEVSLIPVNLIFYQPTDSSFPSNFAAVLFTVGTAVFTKNRRIGIVLLTMALLGGFSRIYVGVHYPLDIVGGAAIGILGAIIAFGLSRLMKPWIDSLLGILRKLYLA